MTCWRRECRACPPGAAGRRDRAAAGRRGRLPRRRRACHAAGGVARRQDACPGDRRRAVACPPLSGGDPRRREPGRPARHGRIARADPGRAPGAPGAAAGPADRSGRQRRAPGRPASGGRRSHPGQPGSRDRRAARRGTPRRGGPARHPGSGTAVAGPAPGQHLRVGSVPRAHPGQAGAGRVTRPGSPLIAALQQVLADEHAAVYAYGVIGAHLTGTARARATGDWIAHQRARDSLEATLLRLGSRPAAAAVAYEMPGPVRTRREATAAALVIEDRIAAAYLGLVAAATAAIREQAALQVRAAALRAAAWRGSTVAFPGLPGDGS